MANLPASVRLRLLNLAGEGKEGFGLVLTRYGLARYLYRLSASPHRESFILKGALLQQLWTGETYRQTRDLNLHFRTFGQQPQGVLKQLDTLIGCSGENPYPFWPNRRVQVFQNSATFCEV